MGFIYTFGGYKAEVLSQSFSIGSPNCTPMRFDVSICVICPRALRWVYNLQRPAGTCPCAVRINCSRAKCGCRICGIGRWKLQMGVGILFGCASQSGNSLPGTIFDPSTPTYIYVYVAFHLRSGKHPHVEYFLRYHANTNGYIAGSFFEFFCTPTSNIE